jgi:hypothetical protein
VWHQQRTTNAYVQLSYGTPKALLCEIHMARPEASTGLIDSKQRMLQAAGHADMHIAVAPSDVLFFAHHCALSHLVCCQLRMCRKWFNCSYTSRVHVMLLSLHSLPFLAPDVLPAAPNSSWPLRSAAATSTAAAHGSRSQAIMSACKNEGKPAPHTHCCCAYVS